MVNDISFSEKKYYSISEVSEICSVKPHTLRFWESEFKNLKPVTRKGNRRYYQKQDIEMIKKNGLAKGGSLENAVVVKDDNIMNKGGLRNPKEFVNHKILDCIGDLYTTGYRIIASIKCCLLYTSPSPRDRTRSRMPSSA